MASFAWSYTGELGPDHWGKLCLDCKIASKGKRQSPIDLPQLENPETDKVAAAKDEDEVEKKEDSPVAECENEGMDTERELALLHLDNSENPTMRFQTKPVKAVIENNGLTVQVTAEAGSSVLIKGRAYELVQFHFHAPAEHTVSGVRYSLEMHLVHQALPGQGPGPSHAVVGQFFEVGAPNDFLDQVFRQIPPRRGLALPLEHIVDLRGAVQPTSAFVYDGSLTTPPCSEGIQWCIVTEPLSLSQDQLDMFKTAIPFDSFRPIQPRNGREIETCSCSVSHG